MPTLTSDKPVEARIEPAVLAQTQRPVLRVCAAFFALYYLVISLSHPFFERGLDLAVLLTLSSTTTVSAFLIWRRLATPLSLARMELAALVLFGLPLANVVAQQLVLFEPLKLVYFVILALAFAISAPTRRVGYSCALAAMVALVIMAGDVASGDLVGGYVYVGLAGLFAGVGISQIMRGAFLREIRARLAAEELNQALRRELSRNLQLTREAQDLAVTARAADRAKSEFLATMSHEIRTPLNGVLGMAQIMAREPLPDAQKTRLAIMQESAEGLLDILNAVLDISQIEAGQMTLHNAKFEMARFAATIEAVYGQLARQKGLDFQVDLAARASGPRLADEVRLRQVLGNLVANAIKFTQQGSVRVLIDGDAHGLTFEVIDTGPGIPADRQPHIFDRFVQADGGKTRAAGGTGLGLAICRELTTLMGGDLSFRSHPGRTAFKVQIPAAALQKADPPPQTGLQPSAHEADLTGRRVLIVDDNAANRGVLQSLLAELGCVCGSAEDGLEAISVWRTAAWDAVPMDVHMPRLDGIEATRLIRKEEAASGLSRTPIVAVTASVLTHETQAYIDAGMDAVLAKPVMMPDLIDLLARLSPGAELQTEARSA
ncbi:MAG: ATP-binding protein [Pseudomonadota bacterium]